MDPIQQKPIDLGDMRKVYFDTSAWNYLSKRPDRATLVRGIKQSATVVLASVISVGEILRTSDAKLRQLMCSTIRELHGDGLLLERPEDLAVAAAEALRRGEKDMLLPRTGPGNTLYSYMCNPTSPPTEDIWAWLRNMDRNLNRFIDEIRPSHADTTTQYCTPQVLEREDFLQILCELPPTKHLNLSTSEVRQLCERSDAWKALGAMFACTIELSTTYAPKSKYGKKRPGGPDLRQAAYLGVVEVFVTGDVRLLDATIRISACLRYPRCVVSSEEFISGALSEGGRFLGPQGAVIHNCRVCGCRLPTRTGMHATALLP
jgi:hypothetical protein